MTGIVLIARIFEPFVWDLWQDRGEVEEKALLEGLFFSHVFSYANYAMPGSRGVELTLVSKVTCA